MKNELKSYLKNLSTKKNNETKPKKTEISEAGNVFNTTNFSTF